MDFEAVIIAALLAVALAAAFVVIYQNAKMTAHLPHAPFGVDVEVGLEEQSEVGGIGHLGRIRRRGSP